MPRSDSPSCVTEPTAPIDPPRLALRPREAAQALGIGRRLLWSLTNQGKIPHARLGKCIVYPVESLQTWLAQQTGEVRL